MLKHLKVKNMNGKFNFDLNFHSDLNIITGRNGSGKTTLLKLIWYVLSGKIVHHLEDLTFDLLELETESNIFSLQISSNKKKIHIKKDGELVKNTNKDFVNFLRHNILPFNNTLFLPTFRRTEGGYHKQATGYYGYEESEWEEKHTLTNIFLGEGNKKDEFITAYSTEDIEKILTAKYAQISDEILQLDKIQSDFVLEAIESKQQNPNNEQDTLKDIQQKVQATKAEKEKLFKPIQTLSNLVEDLFTDKGIIISETLRLGDAKSAIPAEKLSAGEKQMLGFVCYSMFAENSIIFIDEPELSLHTDWQEVLLPTLLEVSNGNQFFIATHSPFIYYRYPDKEICLSPITTPVH